MTKKSFPALVSAVFLVLMIAACGDGNMTKDGCTIGKSFGTHSLRTRKDVSQTCIKEIAAALFPECGWQSSEESAADHIASLQRLDVTFGNECKDKNDADKSVKCPDFVPKSLKLTKLSGCEVYSIDPHTSCIAPCADLYFLTDNDTFKTVYAGSGYSYEDKLYNFIKSSGEGGVSLESKFVVGTNEAVFTWLEKAENGAETEKKISVEMEITDPVTGEEEVQCEDSEGRKYKKDDKIALECDEVYCTAAGWHPTGDPLICDVLCPNSIGDKKNWLCADGVTEVDWCECVTDEETGGKWICPDRVDLNCPTI